jgi:glycosyltransferase involved in cell wall biosynthesis
MDISIILTCHAEALLLHRTILSIERMRKLAETKNLRSEVIVVVDNPTEDTSAFFKKHNPLTEAYKILFVSFGDAGLSRNLGVQHATGKYIALHDGDDIFSVNWIWDAYKLAETLDDKAILHPEYTLTFGSDQQFLHHQFSQDNERFHHRSFLEYNPYDALAFANRKVFEDNPYNKTDNGTGFEDWLWNLTTIAHGYRHYAVSETVLFIRKKRTQSRLSFHVSQQSVIDKTPFLDPFQYVSLYENIDNGKWWGKQKAIYDRSRKIGIGTIILLSFAKIMYVLLLGVYTVAKRVKRKDSYYFSYRIDNFLRYLIVEIKAFFSNIEQPSEFLFDNEPMPLWLLDRLDEANKVEAELISDPGIVKKFVHYQLPPISRASAVYYDICTRVGGYYDHIVLAPWLKTGGSDLVTVNYVNTLLRENHTSKILVILTENTSSEWLSKLHERAIVLPFGNLYKDLSKEQMQKMICRIVLQFNCKHLHLINSKLGFDAIASYGRLMRKYTDIYPHAYCYVIDDQDNYTGYAFKEINSIYPYATYILTENKYIISFLVEKYGYDPAKFKCIYQPVKHIEEKAKPIVAGKKLRIMWAGRFDKQKRPHLLVKIARRLYELDKDIEIHVFGKKLLDNYFSEKEFSGLKNVVQRGPYSDWGQLNAADFDVFLYTSIYDGMPNVVLEALSSGMVVVSPRQGGLPEVIENGVNGFLVPNTEQIEPYIDAILKLKNDPGLKETFYTVTRQKLLSHHSPQSFNAALSLFDPAESNTGI